MDKLSCETMSDHLAVANAFAGEVYTYVRLQVKYMYMCVCVRVYVCMYMKVATVRE